VARVQPLLAAVPMPARPPLGARLLRSALR
jgi:hypothetical protein